MNAKLGSREFRSLARALEVAAADSWTSSGRPMIVEYRAETGVYAVWSKKVRDQVPSLAGTFLIATVAAEDLPMALYSPTFGKVKR